MDLGLKGRKAIACAASQGLAFPDQPHCRMAQRFFVCTWMQTPKVAPDEI